MSHLKETYEPTGYETAVIGMAGRFPGAGTIDTFWENLKEGKESIRFFTQEELFEAGVLPDVRENSVYVKAKGVLDDVDCFDASFFNYTHREADMMDPQLRLLHQCSWHALEDAGYNPERYAEPIGFYAGATTHLYWIARMLGRLKSPSEKFDIASVNDGYAVSTQVAYRLKLSGPAVTVQTACSTSLVAIHQACQALLSGECDMALAGGVSVQLPVKNGYCYQEGMVFSPDGHCRAFDARARGTVEGNGAGIVVLKTLENALRDRDRIYAVVKGSAVNNDGGRKVGFAAPSVAGQAEVIQMAQQAAALEPESISYVETHGTGTRLGDPVEFRALCRAFATNKRNFCRIGSVKSNIGHLDSAAGAAGFIKTVLALYHRMIPPSLHFDSPNPEIDFENSPFLVNTKLTQWRSNGYPLRAGVSSFGIGGTNAHVVLEEWPGRRDFNHEGHEGRDEREHKLIVLSARTRPALERLSANLGESLKSTGLADAAYTLQLGRKAFEYRGSAVFRDAQEAVDILSSTNSKRFHTHRLTGDIPALIFMFPGLGSQYVNMGLDLYRSEPVFREAMDRCFDTLSPLTGYDLKKTLYPSVPSVSSVANSFLAIFILEYALSQLLLKWGLRPQAMIGYSFGEYAAACAAGVFDVEDALRLIVHRGELINRTGAGAMLSVPLTCEELLPLLNLKPHLSLAIDNGPSCVVAGPRQAVKAFEKEMKQRKLLCLQVDNGHALHSPLMDNILTEFEKKVAEIKLQAPQIPIISNVTGTRIQPDEAVDPGYWRRHLRETVRFSDGIKALVKEPGAVFVEVGPGRDLTALVQRYLKPNQKVLNLVRHPQKQVQDCRYLLERIGRLWSYGIAVDWEAFHNGEERYRVSLPPYPFEKQRFPWTGEETPSRTMEHAQTESPRYSRILPENYEAPANHLEEKIAEAFQTLFSIDRVGVNEDFFELGGDSLKAITLVNDLQQRLEFNEEIPLDAVFNHPTVKALADFIGKQGGEPIYLKIEPAEQREYYPLSSSQQRVFTLVQLDKEGVSYNMPSLMWIEGPVDTDRLERVCKQLIRRHESLRTGFFMQMGEPVQRVYESVEFEVVFDNLATEDTEDTEGLIKRFIRPFDLGSPPLWRVTLFNAAPDKYLLVDDMHHIISDDISIGVLIKELSRLYDDESLEELPLQYKDYALWQRQGAGSDTGLKEQEGFWKNLFADAPGLPVLNMPCDFPRPTRQSFEGGEISFKINPELYARLLQLAAESGTTLFVLLFTVYNTLLYRYTGQEDIIVGTPITGRSHKDMQQVVGMFVNTLALRNQPAGDKTFADFLQEVKETTLKAFSYRRYQFEDLLEKLPLPRDISRNPLFDTMFVLHTVDLERIDIKDLKIYPYEFENPVSKFDFTLNVSEAVEGLNLILEYSTALFERKTMERFKDHFKNLLQAVTRDPAQNLDKVEIMSQEEKQMVTVEFNRINTDPGEFPIDKTIHGLFEEQVEKTPNHAALFGLDSQQEQSEVHMTYRMLNERSNQFAHVLKEKGVTANSIVAIMMERGLEIVIAILSILKAGAAYLPIDPEYPQDRIDYMLADSNAKMLLTAVSNQKTKKINDSSAHSASSAVKNIAYVIYTSGTTGRPRGVMIEHRSVVNLCCWHNRYYGVTAEERAAQYAPFIFDASVWEVFPYLVRGASLYIVDKESRLDMEKLAQFYRLHRITFAFLPTPAAEQFMALSEVPESMRVLVTGGDKLRSFIKRSYTLYNNYGPTENTVVTTAAPVVKKMPNISIGKPIDNCAVYIVDRNYGPLPIGVPGELTVSGAGVARGYLNQPELTAEKFVISDLSLVISDPNDQCPMTDDRLYRTGDLARWLPDGDIEFLGRLDHQVKLRGYRVELGEIENRLTAHPAVKEAVVTTGSDDMGDKYLCAYIVAAAGATLDSGELKEHLSRYLPGYMIPAYFMPLESLPLTPNGKLDRKALPEPVLEQKNNNEAPRNGVEEVLAKAWAEILGIEKVFIDDNFFEIGGDSIKGIRIASRLKEHHLDVTVNDFFMHRTIKELSKHVKKSTHRADQGPVTGQVHLTPIQHWFFRSGFNCPAHFNQSVMIYREEGFDDAAVEQVLQHIAEHHDALRMVFRGTTPGITQENLGPGIVQELFRLEVMNLKEIDLDEAQEAIKTRADQVQASFSLDSGPLLKGALFKTRQGDHLLLVIHHLVVDGISWRIILEDFESGYKQAVQGETPRFVPKTDSFRHWAAVLKEYAGSSRLEKELDYWRQLAEIRVPPLHVDHLVQENKNKLEYNHSLAVTLDRHETEKLLKQCHAAYNTGIEDLLLTALALAVKEWKGNEKMWVNLEGHGRERVTEGIDVSRTVGWFTSQYPVLLDVTGAVSGDLSYPIKYIKETLRRVPGKGIGYGLLKYCKEDGDKDAAEFAIEPGINFNYLGEFGREFHGSEDRLFKISEISPGQAISPENQRLFPLDIDGIIMGDELQFSFSYNMYQYETESIETLGEIFKQKLAAIIAHCTGKEEKELTPADVGYSGISLEDFETIEAALELDI
jgi:amino acid adenylation domain-containing protein/non-ribosomal peptide synthase protein (TIGR01720 family)